MSVVVITSFKLRLIAVASTHSLFQGCFSTWKSNERKFQELLSYRNDKFENILQCFVVPTASFNSFSHFSDRRPMFNLRLFFNLKFCCSSNNCSSTEIINSICFTMFVVLTASFNLYLITLSYAQSVSKSCFSFPRRLSRVLIPITVLAPSN